MWTWLLLLALVVFAIYWLALPRVAPPQKACGACAKKQNVSPLE